MNLYDIRDFNWNAKYRLFFASQKDLIPKIIKDEEGKYPEKFEIINKETGNSRVFTFACHELEYIPSYVIDQGLGDEELAPVEIQFLVYHNIEDNLSCQITVYDNIEENLCQKIYLI